MNEAKDENKREIDIREMRTLEDFQSCVNLQKLIWGFDDPYDIVPLPLLIVSDRIDGIVMGAYRNNEMIGFVYSLPGIHKGQKVQWSHMLAVLPEYQNADIGYQLKLEQYRISQEKGYETIEWTYDPLQSRNAHFNLKKLGCIAVEYEINIYGETSSPLHMGTPTDRLIAHWQIPPLKKSLPHWNGIPEPPDLISRTKRVNEELLLIEHIQLDAIGEYLFLEIPVSIQKVTAHSKDAALDWRFKTRECFLQYLANGYVVYSFLLQDNRSFYILKKIKEIRRSEESRKEY
jgi:predicted GNAT superfamily acetyltransferase